MSIGDFFYDVFVSWWMPDPAPPPKPAGVEVKLNIPREEPIVYGRKLNVEGEVVNSKVINPIDEDDIPNDILYLQIVWSAGKIEEVEKIYLDGIDIDSTNFNAEGEVGARWVYYYNYVNGENVTFETSDGGQLTFESRGYSYSVIRLEYSPSVIDRLPKITADIKGIKVSPIEGGTPRFSTNYAEILKDYLTNKDYGRGLAESKIDATSLVAARDFCNTQIYHYDDSVSSSPMMTCNIRLNGNDKLITNVNKILKGCRGYLPYIKDVFHFVIEGESTTPIAYEITNDQLMSDFSVDDVEIKDYYNKVTVRFADDATNGKVSTAVYPTDNTEYQTYLAEDKGVPYEKTITIDTITNMYEALHMAEIILKRSRNALGVTVSVKPEGNAAHVGSIVNVTNSGFGMVQKPFIVTAKGVSPLGIVKLTLLEFQHTIYPWTSKFEQVIPDSSVVDYRDVATPTNLRITYPDDGTAQGLIEWDSPHSSFLIRISDEKYSIITGNAFYAINNTTVGTRTITVKAINGLGYHSKSASLEFTIALPAVPTVTVKPTNFEIEIVPATADNTLTVQFEMLFNTVNNFNTAVPSPFTIVGLTPDTFYFMWVRAVNVAGASDWYAFTASTTNDKSVLGDFLDVRGLSLQSDSQVFSYKAGGEILPDVITFNARASNLDLQANPLVWSSVPSVTLTGTGDSRTVTKEVFDAADTESLTVTVTSGSFTDTMTIVKLDGSGIDGVDAIAGYLTNEAHTVSADNAGDVLPVDLTVAGGTFKVYSGTTDVTSSALFSVVSSDGVTLNINANTGVYTVSAVTGDTGTATLQATYSGVTITKIYSISKSKLGDTGNTGDGSKIEFSENGVDGWHDIATPDDKYLRSCTNSNGGAWTCTGATKIEGAAAPEKYSWTVYSDSMTTGTIYTSNSPHRRYTGVSHNQSSQSPNTSDHSLYNWYLSVDVIDLSDSVILANKLNAVHIDVDTIDIRQANWGDNVGIYADGLTLPDNHNYAFMVTDQGAIANSVGLYQKANSVTVMTFYSEGRILVDGNINSGGTVSANSFIADGNTFNVFTATGDGGFWANGSGDFKALGGGSFYVGANEVYHAGNLPPVDGGNANTLEGQNGAYYLNWNNFTNKPSTFTPSTHNHTYIDSVDDRDVKPNIPPRGVSNYFTSLGGLTGSANSDYQDLLVLNTYQDSSGGMTNALAFDKSTKSIKHFLATFDSTSTWGSYETLAYLSSTVANADKLGNRAAADYMQANYLNGYEGLGVNGNFSNFIRSPLSGLIPYDSSKSSYLGTSSWQWKQIHGALIYRAGVEIDSRYLRVGVADADDVGAIPKNTTGGTPVAAYYHTSASGSVGTKIRLPFNTNSDKMVAFTVRVYQNYQFFDVAFSGYLYGTINNWYSPKAILSSGSTTIAVKMGRDSDGRGVCLVRWSELSWCSCVQRYRGVQLC